MVRKIRQASVIGSGIMGGGIAALLASTGIKTLLMDIVPFDLKDEEKDKPAARNKIVAAGFQGVLKSKPALLMSKKDAAKISIGNLEDDFDKLADCDLIVEVVIENVKIKQDLLKRIEGIRKPTAIVTTNTSGIPLKVMTEGLSNEFKQHFCGTHFFNPVRYMHLLELIPGEETLPEVLDFISQFGEKYLGKGIVWAKDTPAFIGNRIGLQGMGKILSAVKDAGLTFPEADALLGPAIGRPKTATFKTTDMVGLDTMQHVMKNNYDLCKDDEDRDLLILPDFITQMIEKNLLGLKTGAGFYKKEKTPEGKKVTKVLNTETWEYEAFDPPSFPCLDAAKKESSVEGKIKAIVNSDDKGGDFIWTCLSNMLIYSANRIPEISDTIVDIDNALKWGNNHKLGPFEVWDAIGVKESVERMEKEGQKVPEAVKKMVEGGNTAFYKAEGGKNLFFDLVAQEYKEVSVSDNIISLPLVKKDSTKVVLSNDSASLIDLGDGVFCCEFHTKMNAMNQDLSDIMTQSIDYVDENGVGLVIGNQGEAFSAGADISFILGKIKAGDFDFIDDFIKKGQDGIQKARYSSFPIVAAPFGMTLGGGAELCIGAADRIVAHAELYIGLVEMGVGLVPAGTGCMNIWKRFVSQIPDAVGSVDLLSYFVAAFQNIAQAKVSTSAAEARENGFLGPKDRIVFNRDALIGEAKKEVLKMVDEGYVPQERKPIRVFGDAAHGVMNAQLYNMLQGRFMSEHDAFVARKIVHIISGGEVRVNSEIDEQVILNLERQAFVDLLKTEKTVARIEHMLKTGKPLRN
ncbi:MAG: 3-hydroxyacyl-CoA dehydrogenase/enoyl-CoA hydratase family protein [Desulfobacterales bacterium]|jgi:3-hydroxyacyl-CoA dehydrogenase|nr:3-hydroxyacyl-CoA dehydrogenase/enoyl-CoA hydratase family protein [Desulfobacteraceae bacterium]MBT4364186.1 3-hydroxyacyl-CoA dehydrogenase/enoyl-CoA hydratase family protein [Desulfobacteraceae bacterium]MBT7085976.1 3-hydroxyacyl-CoA dehydrogenase/enoyl-CoA hydratase family protein [Desulfobacterales bacterium]MBT7697986.1 3-hydroxyacyl-CoA dehydrogenase/enoyl-CoA hydratase family protein [Desulfobacterales bacterium]